MHNTLCIHMRRLILEVTEKELLKIGLELPTFRPIKTLELLYFLRQDDKEFAAISQVEFKDPSTKIDQLLEGGYLSEAQVLERQKNGAYIVFLRSGPSLSSTLSMMGIESGYLFPPLGIRDGKVKFSYLGSEQQIKAFLEGIDAVGVHYRILLLSDLNFSPISPLNRLTEKQRDVLITAYRMGYYDVPRRGNSQDIAKKLGLVDSTVVEHLRKAEQRLIRHIIEVER
ncbi:helix-turn-helix domain-containing protein [Candidatus Bathyarchaeota archaeon]|nr:helix-turn-helix domain-containing protein [Candidatus Bathyarchaeota archaeon]